MMTDLECFVEDLFHAYRNAPGAEDLNGDFEQHAGQAGGLDVPRLQ